MGIKIKQIQIQNFKLFKNFSSIQLDDNSLIVLDGPNGFGKTSFYDAIELLFTGKLRRYSSLPSITDARQVINGNPFVHNDGVDNDDDLFIKAQIEINGATYFLMRKENCGTLIENGKAHQFTLPLYILTTFEASSGEEIEGSDFFNNLLGIDFNKNFEFLNYVEQEENIDFLKNKDKDRKAKMAHLFNTIKIDEKINKLSVVHVKVKEKCNPEAKREYKKIKQQHGELLSSLKQDIEETEYLQLFESKDLLWDKEILVFADGKYSQWLGEEGELKKLNLFITNFEEFNKKNINDKLDELVVNEESLKQLLVFYKFLEKEEEISAKLLIHTKLADYLKGFEKGSLYAIENERVTIPIELRALLKDIVDIEKYNEALREIKEKVVTTDKLSKLLSNVATSRSTFIENYINYHSESPDSNCPLCGYDWKEAESLIKNFDEQTSVLKELIKESGNELMPIIEDFDKLYFQPINLYFVEYVKTNPIDISFISKLKLVKKMEPTLVALKDKFLQFEIDLEEYYNNEEKYIDVSEHIILIKKAVLERKKTVDLEKVKDYFGDLFLSCFDEKIDNVANINTDIVAKKIKFIEWKYLQYQNEEIVKLDNQYIGKKSDFDSANIMKLNLKKIIDIYKSELSKYQEVLIGDIEILFHIYSGRIMQDYQNGLGLFIKSDQGEIRFIESMSLDINNNADYNQHDAIFSMSSGQLAALVLSFTLALNKRYSKSELLFIDDPVQTLDELNIAGFVNLLRNEFSDRQIFMSTHEEMMSVYMRYKFDKFGLKTERINFKEKYIEE
jgi:DNA repair exonuclease SbcCD ATPase subunit